MSLPLRVWNGTEWVEIGSGLGQVYYQNNQPSTAATGDLWVDSDGEASPLDPTQYATVGQLSEVEALALLGL
jgi:hypothetical protein